MVALPGVMRRLTKPAETHVGRMVRSRYDLSLPVVVALTLVLGVGGIFTQRPLLTTAGVLLIIVGLMSLMPLVRLGLADGVEEFEEQAR